MTEQFTLDDLKAILRVAAGEDEQVDLDGDIIDVAFDQLGYDSLALLETGARIEREWGIALSDSTIVEAETPRALLAMVNKQLAAAAGR